MSIICATKLPIILLATDERYGNVYWHQLKLELNSNAFQVRLALHFAQYSRNNFLILCTQNDEFLGIIDTQEAEVWVRRHIQNCKNTDPLSSLAYKQTLTLNENLTYQRARKVMVYKNTRAVPALEKGRIVGLYRI